MTFIFRNRTIFWDIPKWNRGQTKWDGGGNQIVHKQAQAYSSNIYPKLEHLILFDNELKLNKQV